MNAGRAISFGLTWGVVAVAATMDIWVGWIDCIAVMWTGFVALPFFGFVWLITVALGWLGFGTKHAGRLLHSLVGGVVLFIASVALSGIADSLGHPFWVCPAPGDNHLCAGGFKYSLSPGPCPKT